MPLLSWEGPGCSYATSLRHFLSSPIPHSGPWPEAICLANGQAGGEQVKGGKCLGLPESIRDSCA